MKEKEYEIYTLKNGIRIIHREVNHTKIAHCGFILDVGSRDEEKNQMGLAHFWEHMAFKGTKKRKSFHIINRLEVLGGELNAYTTKEKICFYASVIDKHYEKSMELLSDITFNSTFPIRELEKERGVILEEMSMYADTPEDAIQDDFESLIFGEHPLGFNILGTPGTVKAFKEKDFKKFVRETLDTEKLIFSSIGNIPFKKVKVMADKYLAPISACTANHMRIPFKKYIPSTIESRKNIHQAHCMIGRTAYKLKDERRIPFFMLVNLLGGPAMNSKLNLELRERNGFVYNIEANYSPLIDTGLFSIYFATEKKQLEKSIRLVLKELDKFKNTRLGSLQLHYCKEQLIGQLAMAEESNINFMQMMGKSILDLGYVDSLEDIFNRIKKVTATEIMEISNDIFKQESLSFLKYIPD
ncbi:MAG: insulinase family protein [Cytophagaceae bacterium]|nr:insulinase family protein [Cytophagaceae bacterium]